MANFNPQVPTGLNPEDWMMAQTLQRFASNPSIAPQPSPTPGAPAPQAAPDSENDTDRLQAMLAPYQVEAQRLFGGNPVFGNSPFATNHPRLAGLLSNTLIAASHMGSGKTTAENIGIGAKEALAPMELARQRAIQQQMFPMQMLGPQVALGHNLAEMNELNARAGYYRGAQTDLANARAMEQQAHAASLTQGKPVQDVDQFGHPWWVSPDGTAKPVDPNFKPGYAPTLQTQQQIRQHMVAAQHPFGSSTEGDLLAMQFPPKNGSFYTPEELKTIRGQYNQDISEQAGFRSGGTTTGAQNAPHTFANRQTLITEQRPYIFKDIIPPDSITIMAAKTGDKSAKDELDNYQKQYDARQKAWANYVSSDGPDTGESFQDFLGKMKSGNQPSTTAPSAPVNSGSKWQPK